ncbi:hypothetical protein FPV67DRAFT_784793 [Lyophyllum atratum]|nr:hypothetical protein FPV67DRAFT_784793 [Lyophyllum atratum]
MFLISRVGRGVPRPRKISTPCITRVRHIATASNIDASPRQGAGATRRLPPQIRELRNLDPQRIQPQDFIDISNYKQPRVMVGSHRGYLRYTTVQVETSRGSKPVPFPPKSHGFLYYHHDPKLPPTTGEVRFRLTSHDDPAQFHRGDDLIGAHGGPWAIGVLAMTKAYLEPFRIRLLKDNLFDSDLMRLIQDNASRYRFYPKGTYLHSLEQPFSLDLARRRSHPMHIFTPHATGAILINSTFADLRKEHTKSRLPYSGRILVRFERSTLPEHAGTRSLVLRVLDIQDPIKVVIPGYDMYLPIPTKGCLVERYRLAGKGARTAPRPYSINLDRPVKAWKDIGLLLPESE